MSISTRILNLEMKEYNVFILRNDLDKYDFDFFYSNICIFNLDCG